jgi:hypothetical protein
VGKGKVEDYGGDCSEEYITYLKLNKKIYFEMPNSKCLK